jgi:Zn finger protein HypA/HybF involved in hydrogenase expression
MIDDKERLLECLASIPRGSHIEPSWEPRAAEGVVYFVKRRGMDVEIPLDDLELLADRGYLERIFVERLMICPTCHGHAVNVHEACVTCNSANLTPIVTYFHFRCGYIGPEKTFNKEANGLRCPKCKKFLVDLGTDHDSPGTMFECGKCAATFQQPNMGVRCIACGASFNGNALNELTHLDVFAYRLSLGGERAVAAGALGEAPDV